MSPYIYMASLKEIFIIFCIMQISSALPLGETRINDKIRPKRDINLLQEKLIKVVHPKPILDNITEDEKCCNMQQHLIGKNFLSVFEQVTSAAANAIQIPKQSVDILSAGITSYLDQIGAKLVGLQK